MKKNGHEFISLADIIYKSKEIYPTGSRSKAVCAHRVQLLPTWRRQIKIGYADTFYNIKEYVLKTRIRRKR